MAGSDRPDVRNWTASPLVHARVADRVGGNRAALSVARKMVRRAHHTLRALGDQALAPV